MLILLFFGLTNTLFAGNGIMTYSYTLEGKEIDMACDTYDDCYTLLCIFLSDPSLSLTTIQPNNWDGNCNQLDSDDDRELGHAELDAYSNNTIIAWTVAVNMSYTSKVLCQFNKNKNITWILYLPAFQCYQA